MKATKRLSVGAVMAALALLGAAVFGGVADAQKKKKAKKINISKTQAIPDATQTCVDTDGDGFTQDNCTGNGAEYKEGILALRLPVRKKADGLKVRDINLQVTLNHPDPSDLGVFFLGPTGRLIDLYGGFGTGNCENHPPGTVTSPPFYAPNGRCGPTTFDDESTVYANDVNSCPNPQSSPPDPADCDPSMGGFTDGGGVEAFAPLAGTFKPADGVLDRLARKLTAGTAFQLIVTDGDAPNTCSLPGCTTAGDPADTTADIADTGSASARLTITPKRGKKK